VLYDAESHLLRIGPLVTIHALETSTLIWQRCDILAQAAYNFGSPQIRNLATVAGNLCNASPAADTAPPLLALAASLRLISPRGERTIGMEGFFSGPFQNVLQEGELLAEIQVPAMPPQSAGIYLKHTIRNAMDHAMVGVAAVVTLADGACQDIKIALGAVAPTPMRAIKAEEILRGNVLEESLIEEAAKAASGEAQPRTDPEYKREMVRVLTRRAVTQAWERARQP